MVARIALTFSLTMWLAALAVCGPYGDLDARLKNARTSAERTKIMQSSDLVLNDPDLAALVEGQKGGAGKEFQSDVNDAESIVALRAAGERSVPQRDEASLASDVKRNPLFSDPGVKNSSNWLGDAIERLKNLRFPHEHDRDPISAPGILGPWVIDAAWVLLGAAVIAFGIYAVSRIDVSKRRSRKSRAIVDEDEPERTLDEWLALADKLESEGEYRRAVRGLYVACLMKFDEARVVRFDRGQTNWEHLARIEVSPRLPEGLRFRPATQAFDRIWYGHQTRGKADVDQFRAWYREIDEALRRIAA